MSKKRRRKAGSAQSNEAAYTSIENLNIRLGKLGEKTAEYVAKEVAPLLSKEGLRTFDQRMAPSGWKWPPGKKPEDGDLVRDGSLRKFIRYSPYGTKVGVRIGVDYAPFQIGKRPVYPYHTQRLPDAYANAIIGTMQRLLGEEFEF